MRRSIWGIILLLVSTMTNICQESSYTTSGEAWITYDVFFQAEDGIRGLYVTGVQTCALPISGHARLDVAQTLELDLSDVEPSMAGPKRPQDRVPLSKAAEMFKSALEEMDGMPGPKRSGEWRVGKEGRWQCWRR